MSAAYSFSECMFMPLIRVMRIAFLVFNSGNNSRVSLNLFQEPLIMGWFIFLCNASFGAESETYNCVGIFIFSSTCGFAPFVTRNVERPDFLYSEINSEIFG